ncbi:hypothetical protein [Enterocloster bolteae]|uniref:hypothetical protein n=1 Tax=Enterocloster bolteae TaxID=208479 RepID=UPI002A819B12|nr:hypothetical protein [Enterocloster bolteae]
MKNGAVRWIMENPETWRSVCGVGRQKLTKEEFYDLLDMTILHSKDGEGYEVMLLVLLTVYRDWTIL